eukprot:8620414-Alexandrium_andersonii.AAC.1
MCLSCPCALGVLPGRAPWSFAQLATGGSSDLGSELPCKRRSPPRVRRRQTTNNGPPQRLETAFASQGAAPA